MEILTGETDEGLRLDKFISEHAGMTRSAAALLIENGHVSVNNANENKSYKVQRGDRISFDLPEPQPTRATAEDIPLDIVYEDEYMLVVNKPRGMVVHPAAGNHSGTLVNALLYHCGDSLSGINGVIRPGIVHRIDKDTSGLLAVAKTDKAHLGLAEQIKDHSFRRVYYGLVYGKLSEKQGRIDLPIGRSVKDRKKMAVTEKNSKPAVTDYEVEEEYRSFSLVKFSLYTGRTHQIRVHMSHIGHAIVADPVYSPKNIRKSLLTGQYLHAALLGFRHPISGEYLEFDTGIPNYFTDFILKYGQSNIFGT